jgi:ferredoxin-type protein NapH
MNKTEVFAYQYMRVPLVIMVVLWGVGLVAWLAFGQPLGAVMLVYVGLFVGVGLGLFLALPDRKRQIGRRVMMFMVGLLLLVLALVTDHGNMQIEGLFFGVLAGAAPYIILHYLLAKIAGPLIFGRIWCGWACWYGMIFDLLPFPQSRYRRPGPWGLLRYAHFAASLLLVLVLWFGLGYEGGALGPSGMRWFLVGLAIYYIVGISLAFGLRDNRAFCKYLCPIAVLPKITGRFALLKVSGTPEHCGDCEACVEMCPMNIRVRDYIVKGERVLSTECTLCQTCIQVCPHESLKLSFGLDVGGREYVDYEPPKRPQNGRWWRWLQSE